MIYLLESFGDIPWMLVHSRDGHYCHFNDLLRSYTILPHCLWLNDTTIYILFSLLCQLDYPKLKVSQVFVNFDCDLILKYYSQIDALDTRYSNVFDILLQ